MRSRIGRRILAGYLAVSVLLAALLAASAGAATWITELSRRVDRANRAAAQVLTALVLVDRWLFAVLRQGLDPDGSSREHRLLGQLLRSQVDRLDSARPAASGAGRSSGLVEACGAAAEEFLAGAGGVRQVLACHRDLRAALERLEEQAQREAAGGAARLEAMERAAWLPGFLRHLARNSQRAQRLSQAVRLTLQFESRLWRRLSASLSRLAGAGGAAAFGTEEDLRLLADLERLAPSSEVAALVPAVRAAAVRTEARRTRLEGAESVRALVAEAQEVVSRLETLRPLLEVERDRALTELALVNDSVLSFVRAFSTAAVGALVAGFLVLLAVTGSMTASLEALRTAMERVRDGHLDARVPVGPRRDETAEMARVFNRMVAELRESREKLQAYQEDLQRLVRERTQALEEAQAQLVQAEKLSAVGELVAGVAHELNNPLTSVLGYAQLLESDPALPAELRAYAGILVREADRARQIVQSLLTFARPQPVERHVLDLNEVVRQTLEVPRWDLGRVTVSPRYHPEPLWVRANAVQLQQVFTNIVQNALQAMGGGPGRLEVATRRVGDRAVVEFSDTGPGIPAEHLSRVFDPFFTTKKLGEGTGLGLSISYGIVRDHGGTIRAANRPEGGACFSVELPLCEGPGAPQGRAPDPGATPGPA